MDIVSPWTIDIITDQYYPGHSWCRSNLQCCADFAIGILLAFLPGLVLGRQQQDRETSVYTLLFFIHEYLGLPGFFKIYS